MKRDESFGFFGTPDGVLAPAALNNYGSRIAPGEPPLSVARDKGALSLWAPHLANGSDVWVAMQGAPLLRSADSNRWSATESPADAVLALYLAAGDRFVERLAGRFAVAIVDARKSRVVLAVDQFGIEKLAYTPLGDGLAFGNSVEQVARTPGRNPQIDPQALFDYLVMHMVPAPASIFAGVRKLRPGHCLTFENGRFTEKRYWQARFTETVADDFDGLKDDLFASLRTAVMGCQPTARSGAFLSGGLDSSTVAGLLSEVSSQAAKTFTIGFGYRDYDETEYSRLANSHFSCEGHEYVVTGNDIADGFPLIARAYDEPFGNSSALPVYFCALFAKGHGMEHLLAGDGGDELFAGNSRYAEQVIFERYKSVPPLFRRSILEPALAAWPRSLDFWLVRKGRGYVQKANVPLPARLENWNLILRPGQDQILHPDFAAAASSRSTFSDMQAVWDAAPANSTLNRMLYYDWQYTLADNDLRKVETMSRLAGVRVSYPMLHPDVVDLSMRVPPQVKMPGMKLRDFYKRATTGFLPDQIINKKKHGFGLPFGLWLKETPRLHQQIDDNLADFRSRRIVQPQFIDRLLHLHGEEDAKYYGVFIWVIAMLEQWFKEHRVGP